MTGADDVGRPTPWRDRRAGRDPRWPMHIGIVGGGVYGIATAYYLKRFGAEDVTVFERNEVAGGSTGHSAGGGATSLQRRAPDSHGQTGAADYREP